MADAHWRGSAPEFALNWGGSDWILRLNGPRPGLSTGDGNTLLSLRGLAARGRWSSWTDARARLTGSDCLFDRVEASYAFDGWGDLTVRGTWRFVPESSAVDLEVQVSARSVDFLKALEVLVGSEIVDPAATSTASGRESLLVEPRDLEAARLSYDGRESPERLARLGTIKVPNDPVRWLAPVVVPTPWLGVKSCYIEFAHHEDVARRITCSPKDDNPGSIRYGIFGHDLERGVLLRSRLRGAWLDEEPSHDELDALSRTFRDQPLPLGP